MVRHEIVRAFADPGQVADTELVRTGQGGGEGQPRRIGERAGLIAEPRGQPVIEAVTPQPLCPFKVETQEVYNWSSAMRVILTPVVMFVGRSMIGCRA